eukprot:PhM_4_TR13166/c0_g1_i1/m.59959/K03769/ppiC; peptidyl-prolyl cis-trans isomerase C
MFAVVAHSHIVIVGTLLAVCLMLLGSGPHAAAAARQQPMAHVSHILLSNEETAERVMRRLHEAPEEFTTLAREHSICPSKHRDGDLGRVAKGELLEELDNAIFSERPKGQENIPAGTLMGPIPSMFGSHIILVHRHAQHYIGEQMYYHGGKTHDEAMEEWRKEYFANLEKEKSNDDEL